MHGAGIYIYTHILPVSVISHVAKNFLNSLLPKFKILVARERYITLFMVKPGRRRSERLGSTFKKILYSSQILI